ncbi:TetR/AcrR family transcriptional regulator C-terminal domain-containing protein [Agromyces sp. NPDC058104]|uniref:TetR/AcrR family transcriptional regulator C-terminal domain-containing protein n=1 Tax=Agromyces sp. NPDC058104 TaxID=3346342 RepID=UPI0036D8E38D
MRRCFVAASAAGDAFVEDPDTASAQFLGMISTVAFWPRLLHGGWSQSDAETRRVVHEGALTIVARYGARTGG